MKRLGAAFTMLAITGAVALPVACGSRRNGSCEETSSCASNVDGGEAGADTGGADVQAPLGCDPAAT